MFKHLREVVEASASGDADSPELSQLKQNFQVELENGQVNQSTPDETILAIIARNRPPGLSDEEYSTFVDGVFKDLGRESPFQVEYLISRRGSVMKTLLELGDPDLHTEDGRRQASLNALNKAVADATDSGPAHNVKATSLAGKIVSMLKKQGIEWPGGPKNAAFLRLRSTAESGPQSWVWQLVPIGKGPNPQGFKIGSGIPPGEFANVNDIAWSATRQNGIRMIDVEIPGRGSR